MRAVTPLLLVGAFVAMTTLDGRQLQQVATADEPARLVAVQLTAPLLTAPLLTAPLPASSSATSRRGPTSVGGPALALEEPTDGPLEEDPEPPLVSAWGTVEELTDPEELLDEANDEPADDPLPDRTREDGSSIAVVAREAWIFRRTDWDSTRLGYLRAGAQVSVDPEPVSHRRCSGGWVKVEPRGYVCLGSRATFDLQHPVAQLSALRPAMGDAPYLYVQSRFPPPPLYARLPTEAQQRKAEPSLQYIKRKHARTARHPDYVAPPAPLDIPELLQDGGLLPGLGEQRPKDQVVMGQARVRSGFALLGTYEHQGRRFGLTTDLALLPLDRTRVIHTSEFHGVALSDEFTLPLAFVRSKHARRYRRHNGRFAAIEVMPWRSAWALTGERKRVGGDHYLELRDGDWVREDRVAKVDRFQKAPGWSKDRRRWVDVSILRQSLVAYEGERPVYATLVSTGADGLEDPETTHSTVRGAFLIHTKHISVTMDGNEVGDEFDLRDVPFVQYFHQGYALHGAYWHDDFGKPRSHGCINLAPRDAAWLFDWTTPEVPPGWHAALSLHKGTLVHIHP